MSGDLAPRIVTEKIEQNIEKHCEFFRIFDIVFYQKSDWQVSKIIRVYLHCVFRVLLRIFLFFVQCFEGYVCNLGIYVPTLVYYI